LNTLRKDWECLKGVGAPMACRKRAWGDICKGVTRSALREAKGEKASREKLKQVAEERVRERSADSSSSSSSSSDRVDGSA